MPANFRFSMRKMLLWLTFYALFLAALAGLPVTPIQVIAAVVVLTAFVVIDAKADTDRSVIPFFARCSIVVAHYATAFAMAVAVSFALFLILPEPVSPPTPPLSFLGSVFHIVSGQLFVDIGEPIGRAIAIQIAYYQLFALFSTIAFISSLFGLRRLRSAKWYALLNTPGICLFILFIVAAIMDSIEKREFKLWDTC
jgi:hypothetical protein